MLGKMSSKETSMTRYSAFLLMVFGAIGMAGAQTSLPVQMGVAPADLVLTNGKIYTADARDSVTEAVAIRAGRVVWTGSSAGVKALVGAQTRVIDLAGRFAMPGLVDGHMHPLEAGQKLLKCNLNYEPLTVAQFQRGIQACLDATKPDEPDGWLQVVGWFQQAMLPEGTKTSRATLDGLKTRRPIVVTDSFGHTVLANSRALQLAKITQETRDPVGGAVEHDGAGEPSGVLQDAASDPVYALLPKATAAENAAAAIEALHAMTRQGITSFLDADAEREDLEAFTAAGLAGKLTARAHFAMHIDPAEAEHPEAVVARIVGFRKEFDQGALTPVPTLTVRNAKMYIDGVISGPAYTGAMLEAYLVNAGTADAPRWVPGPTRGPELYYAPEKLAVLLVELAKNGIDPHMHVDGDRAVHVALDAIAALRAAMPGADIRPGLAHCEIVSPADYARFGQLGAFPVLSMQWEKQAPDTVEQLRDAMGPERAKILEPAGVLLAAGAPVAFGSDWPVDRLDEWFALKVGVTRLNAPEAGAQYQHPLRTDPGLTATQAIRANTITAARELHADAVSGSLEEGKFGDVIVLDRDPLTIAPEEIAKVKVLTTFVGGKMVWESNVR